MDTQFVRRADYKKFELDIPRGTRSIEMLFVTPKFSHWTLLSSNSPEKNVTRNPDSIQVPTKMTLMVWNGVPKTYTSHTSNVTAPVKSETQRVAAALNPTVPFSEPDYRDLKDKNGKPLQIKVPYSFNLMVLDGTSWANIVLDPNKWKNPSLTSSYLTDPQPIRLNQWVSVSSYEMQQISSTQDTKPMQRLEVHVYIRATDRTMEQAKAQRAKAKLLRVKNISGVYGFHAVKPDGQPLLEKP
jgi:hypothetical protein